MPISLHSPQRPTLPNGRPCWLRGHIAVAAPELWPQADGALRLTLMLPTASGEFVARQCSHTFINMDAVADFFRQFADDPEGTCEFLWGEAGSDLRIELRVAPHAPAPTTPRRIGTPQAGLRHEIVELTI